VPGYFLLGDSLNTTVTVIATLQNEIVAYNTLQLTYLLIVGIVAQAVGIFAFWNIQKRYQLPTKTMFNAVAVAIILLDGWGMIGIWTDRFGFHNAWEVWLYQAFYGLFVCPWYSYSQTVCLLPHLITARSSPQNHGDGRAFDPRPRHSPLPPVSPKRPGTHPLPTTAMISASPLLHHHHHHLHLPPSPFALSPTQSVGTRIYLFPLHNPKLSPLSTPPQIAARVSTDFQLPVCALSTADVRPPEARAFSLVPNARACGCGGHGRLPRPPVFLSRLRLSARDSGNVGPGVSRRSVGRVV
jgi:hypothetical protein